jgi:hypothetical protein
LTTDEPQSGTTLLSALVGVLVLSLGVATGAGFVPTAAAVAARQQQLALFAAELSQLDEALINALGAVEQPLSLRDPDVALTGEGLSVAWYGGDPDASVVVAWNAEGTLLTTPGTLQRFPRVRVTGAELLAKPVWHLRLAAAPAGGAHRIVTPTGGAKHRAAAIDLIIPVGQLPRP